MAGDQKPGRPDETQVVGPPRLLAGKYRIGRLLGEGGMGSVYLAEHTGLDAEVAVKLLNETCIADPDSLARFRREAKAMGQVRHDNVVAVMDTGTDDDGVPFIVMEYLIGESLSALLRRNRTLAAASACRIASQILAGLSAAHAKGIVHRDLKPGNVFMAQQPDGSVRAKILDFGVSKLLDSAALSVTADGVAVGTPTYMAPEQIRGQTDLDSRVDIYAVGVILYRMLTGKLPFVGGSSEELSGQILAGKPKAPSAIRPEISTSLESIISRAMHTDSRKRFADADEFRAALAAVTAGQLGGAAGQDLSALIARAQALGPTDSEAKTVAASPSAKRETEEDEAASEAAKPRRRTMWLVLGALVVAAIGAFFGLRALSSDGLSGPPLRFGITQFLPTTELEPRFAPFTTYLSKELNRPVELRIASDADELRTWLSGGQVELAALSPFPYVGAKKAIPDLTLVATTVTRSGRPNYFGSILVRGADNIGNVGELKGKPFCFVRQGSTSGWLLPRRALRAAGIDPDSDFPAVHYGQNHLGTLKLLAKGTCAGASVYTKLWHDADEHGLDPAAFRSLVDFKMPHDAYVATPSLPPADVERIRAALLKLEPGSELAKKTLIELDQGGFTTVTDDAYREIAEAVAEEPSL